MEYLRKGYDLERWKGENNKEYLIRKKVLEELEIKINTDMPPEKKISQYKLYKCEWKTGDVFAYKLDGDYAIRNGFKDRYLIVYKINESTWWPGHTIPVVYLKLSQQCEIPKSKDDIEGCEFIKTTFARKKPEYRVQLLSTLRKIIPQNKLTLVGNFTNLSTPGDEYIISDKIYTATCNWSDLEEFAIENYLKFHKS